MEKPQSYKQLELDQARGSRNFPLRHSDPMQALLAARASREQGRSEQSFCNVEWPEPQAGDAGSCDSSWDCPGSDLVSEDDTCKDGAFTPFQQIMYKSTWTS